MSLIFNPGPETVMHRDDSILMLVSLMIMLSVVSLASGMPSSPSVFVDEHWGSATHQTQPLWQALGDDHFASNNSGRPIARLIAGSFGDAGGLSAEVELRFPGGSEKDNDHAGVILQDSLGEDGSRRLLIVLFTNRDTEDGTDDLLALLDIRIDAGEPITSLGEWLKEFCSSGHDARAGLPRVPGVRVDRVASWHGEGQSFRHDRPYLITVEVEHVDAMLEGSVSRVSLQVTEGVDTIASVSSAVVSRLHPGRIGMVVHSQPAEFRLVRAGGWPRSP